MIKYAFLAAGIAVAAPFASATEATTCGPRADVLAVLAKEYRETPTAIGLSSSGRLLELVMRDDGGSWTMLATSPQGVSCVLDAGGDWVMKDFVKLGPAA